MDIQKAVLLFFSALHNPITVAIADFVTTFGSELILLGVILFVYYSIDKTKGAAACLTYMSATSTMGIIKAIVRFPRPWMVIPNLDSQSMEGATGYSFPSGHATCISSSLGSLAVLFKKKWLSRLSAVIILAVAFSRIFLCVHWPLDVACGLLIGISAALFLSTMFEKLLEDKAKMKKILLPIGFAVSAVALTMGILLNIDMIDELAFSDLSKILASLGGMAIGYIVEVTNYDFAVEKGKWPIKIIRYAISMAVVVFLLPILKKILSSLGLYNPITAQLRYFLTGFWTTIFPLLAKKLFPEQVTC